MKNIKPGLLFILICTLFFTQCKKEKVDDNDNNTGGTNQEDLYYDCNSGNCVEDPDGSYATMAECESACDVGSGDLISNPGNGVTDADGNSYTTVVLGNGQEWMAENLRSASYANGDPVSGEPSQILQSLSTGAWSHYDDDEQVEAIHGKHYNWYAAIDSRNVCPAGWHVPALSEFIELVQYLDPDVEVSTVNQVLTFNSSNAGGLLKSVGTDQWSEPNAGATNSSGLSAVPSGDIMYGSSSYMGNRSSWWTITPHPNSDGNAHAIVLQHSNAEVSNGVPIKKSGRSVRCIKD